MKRQILESIARFTVQTQGKWVCEAVEAAGAFLGSDPPYDQANKMLCELLQVAKTNQEPEVLDCLLAQGSEAGARGSGAEGCSCRR
ncbi:MAG: hypothetical protein ACYSR6_10350 [Planctomycetota bacterium]